MSGNQWYDASNNDYSSTYTNVTAEGTGAVAAGGDINAPVATTGGVAGIGNSVGNTTTTTTTNIDQSYTGDGSGNTTVTQNTDNSQNDSHNTLNVNAGDGGAGVGGGGGWGPG
nr:hypothetical protein [Gordonia sp. (in: high G+C Gram-positive bacteria)]